MIGYSPDYYQYIYVNCCDIHLFMFEIEFNVLSVMPYSMFFFNNYTIDQTQPKPKQCVKLNHMVGEFECRELIFGFTFNLNCSKTEKNFFPYRNILPFMISFFHF